MTSLSAEQIKEKVAAKVLEVKQMASMKNALVKEFSVKKATVLKTPVVTTEAKSIAAGHNFVKEYFYFALSIVYILLLPM